MKPDQNAISAKKAGSQSKNSSHGWMRTRLKKGNIDYKKRRKIICKIIQKNIENKGIENKLKIFQIIC